MGNSRINVSRLSQTNTCLLKAWIPVCESLYCWIRKWTIFPIPARMLPPPHVPIALCCELLMAVLELGGYICRECTSTMLGTQPRYIPPSGRRGPGRPALIFISQGLAEHLAQKLLIWDPQTPRFSLLAQGSQSCYGFLTMPPHSSRAQKYVGPSLSYPARSIRCQLTNPQGQSPNQQNPTVCKGQGASNQEDLAALAAHSWSCRNISSFSGCLLTFSSRNTRLASVFQKNEKVSLRDHRGGLGEQLRALWLSPKHAGIKRLNPTPNCRAGATCRKRMF